MFGYYSIINLTPPICISTGILIYASLLCSTNTGTYLSISTTDTIVLGTNPVSSNSYTGYISTFYLCGTYSSAAAIVNGFTSPSGSDTPLSTNGGTACNCGGYSCYNNNPNDCNQCDASCDNVCTGHTSSNCYSPQSLCSPYYYNSALGVCDYTQTYINHCSVMTSNLCDVCVTGYTVSPSNNMCCIIGTYYNSGSCSACYQDCASCSAYPSCLTCILSTASVNGGGTCVCNAGYYQSGSAPLVCTSCYIDCKTCTGPSSSMCLSCSDSNAITTAPGTCNCNINFYASSSLPLICSPCYSDCSSCIGSTISSCTACNDPNAIISSIPNSCLCKSGYFTTASNPIICIPCYLACSTCIGPLINDCATCLDPNAILISGKCQCKLKYYYVTNQCNSCYSTCNTCINQLYNSCLTCVDSNMILNSVPGECLCPNSMYFNGIMCINCPVNCQICQADTCSQCITGYFLQQNVCISCSKSCQDCNGIYSNNCTSCKSNKILINNQCNCSQGYYMDSNENCLNCIANCLNCSNIANCNQCISGYYYNKLSNICELCDLTCAECIGPATSNCILCVNSSIIPQQPSGNCDCMKGYYISNMNPLTCIPCPNNCNNCILGQCTACNQGYELFLNNNTCSEIFFSLKISVNTDNQIVLDFSEDLSNPLSSSDLTTFYESKEVSHTLNYVNPKKYMVNITDLNTTIDSNQIFIQFNKELTSATSSFLNTLNYTCNLLPSPTQYFNKFTATCQIIYQTLMMAAILLGITSMFSGTQSSLV